MTRYRPRNANRSEGLFQNCTDVYHDRVIAIANKISFRNHYTIQIKNHFDADVAKRAIDKSVCQLIPAAGGLSKLFLNLAL